MATKQKSDGDIQLNLSDAKELVENTANETKGNPGIPSADKGGKEPPSKYPAVRILSGSELDAYKNQKVDVEKAERFLAQKDEEEYWRNKKEQKRKKTET